MRFAWGSRSKALYERLSPRQQQCAMGAALVAGGITVLWLVLSLSSSKPATLATPLGPTDTKSTNVDIVAPGSQVSEADQWIGTAGRKLQQYEADRAEQQRVAKENADFAARTLARFAELEKKVNAASVAASAAPGALPASAPQGSPLPGAATVAPPMDPGRYPPDAMLTARGLPPPPPPPAMTARGAMPPGAPPAFAPATPVPMPMLVKVTLPVRNHAPTGGGAGAGAAAPAPSRPAAPTLDTYLPVSFTRGELLGGLDAPTGGQAQSNPQPVLIRLSDNSVLPNRFRAEYRECFVIASGYGEISSERAYLRTDRLSCVRRDGSALEVKIEGGVYGEDGKYGMRGTLVSKQGAMLANALLAGVVGGIGQGLSTAGTTYSTSAFGQVSTTGGSHALKAGVGSGVGKALDRLAQYYIKLAEQTFPVIEVDAGRTIDVVITKGTRIDGVSGDVAQTSSDTTDRRIDDGHYPKANDDADL